MSIGDKRLEGTSTCVKHDSSLLPGIIASLTFAVMPSFVTSRLHCLKHIAHRDVPYTSPHREPREDNRQSVSFSRHSFSHFLLLRSASATSSAT